MATKKSEVAETKFDGNGEVVDAAAVALPSRFKKVTQVAPFVRFDNVGDAVVGKIERKRAEVKGKFGFKNVCQLLITENTTIACGKKGAPPRALSVGEIVQVDVSAGMAALFDFPEGTEVCIVFTGFVDTGKGQPARTYEIGVAS